MKDLITMNQALATTEQLQLMCKNEGLKLTATFMVSRDEIFKIASQQNLDVDDVSKTFGEDVRACFWWPDGVGTNLQVSFFSHLN